MNETPAESDRSTTVRAVLWWVLFANLAVAAAKLVYGLLSGALSLQADGLHSVLDSSSNVIGLVGMRIAATPPDEGHPYGHRKFETLAAMAIGILILGGLWEIGRGTVGALSGGRHEVTVGWPGFAVLAGTVVTNLVVSRVEGRYGRLLRSELLLADAGHTKSDTYATLAVLASFIPMRFGARWADPVGAAVVMVFIGRTAYLIIRGNVDVLTDAARLEPGAVRAAVLSIAGVAGAHKIRSRGPLDHIAVDLHIHIEPGLNVADAHDLTHKVKDAILARFAGVRDVVIHTEPADGREQAPEKV